MLADQLQKNKLEILGKLTAGLIHELRNPLSAVKLSLDYLKMLEDELPGEANDSVNTSLEALERVRFLIENILIFTRKNQNGNGKARCTINDITVEAISIIESMAKKEEIKIIKNLYPDFSPGIIDKNIFLQIFLNLMINAVEACEKGSGIIIIKTSLSEEGHIIWEISDNGKGIPAEHKDKVFNDFFTSKKDGTGLGLGICKMFLDQFESEISFESECGKGTKFFININPVVFQNTYEHEHEDFNY